MPEGGLKGLLMLAKGKSKPDAGGDEGGVETEMFGKAFDAYKAGNRDAFARFMRRGVEMCVEKAQSGGYEEDEEY